MQEWVEKLLAVQEMDLRIDRLKEQIAAVPSERQKAADGVRESKDARDAAHKRVQDCEKQLKHLEMEVDSLESKKADFQTKSTMIKNNEEYRAALHQIDVCDHKISQMEDRELELMEQIEDARAQEKNAKRDLQAAEQRAEQLNQDLDVRMTNCQAQIEKLNGEREPLLEGVQTTVTRRYERLRQSPARINHPDRRALVPIRDDVCDRCRMNVTAQTRMNARKGLAVTCENCGTLLYSEE